MLFGPVLTTLLSHLARKPLFIATLLLFAASNVLATVAPNAWVLPWPAWCRRCRCSGLARHLLGARDVAGTGLGAIIGGLVIAQWGLASIPALHCWRC